MKRRSLFLALICLATSAWAAPKTLTTLCYHRFGPESKDAYKMSVERLGAQLAWLKAQGYQSVSLAQVQAAVDQGDAGMPEKGLILSVDDGYMAGALGAAEFEKYGFKGVFFVNPGSFGHKTFMSWQLCRDLEKRGHEVASHTMSHSNLAKPDAKESPAKYKARVTRELVESKRRLEKELGHPVTALAYPFGAYNPAVTEAATRAGYKLHFSVSDGVERSTKLDPLRIRRILFMGHPGQAGFEKRMLLEPVETPFDGFKDGALFYKGAAGLALSAPSGVKLRLEGKPVNELPGELKTGFHFLSLIQGAKQSKLLFQVARDEWEPHFKALTEN